MRNSLIVDAGRLLVKKVSGNLAHKIMHGEAHWITVKEGPLRGRHLLIDGPRPLPGKRSTGRILAGKGIPPHVIERITGATHAHHTEHEQTDIRQFGLFPEAEQPVSLKEWRSLPKKAIDKIFMAVSPGDTGIVKKAKAEHVLVSYALWRDEKHQDLRLNLVDKLGYRPQTIMLDSGAFTFYKDGSSKCLYDVIGAFRDEGYSIRDAARILKREAVKGWDDTTFHKYIRYVLENRKNVDYVISFDHIKNADNTLYAFKVLKAMGINSVPVYQYGSDPKYLDEYIKAGADYIALGGTANRQAVKPSEVVAWAKPIIEKYPQIKFHLLGTQDIRRIIEKLPGLYSSDGGAWLQSAKFEYNRKGKTREEAAAANIHRFQQYVKDKQAKERG